LYPGDGKLEAIMSGFRRRLRRAKTWLWKFQDRGREILRSPRGIGGAYIVVLLAFAMLYYFMPDNNFYHTTIQYEPATVAHRDQFQTAINKDLRIEKYDTKDTGFAVSTIWADDFTYRTGSASFRIAYYYYNFEESDRSTFEGRCGASEKSSPLYRRTIRITLAMATSASGLTETVRGRTEQPINGCDREVLGKIYKSFEITADGFQAMVTTSPNTLDLLHAVAEEQLGNAPRMFWVDRATRMLYFSVAAITTTGFGDILPTTAIARLMAALECLSGIVLAGAFVNAITSGRS
jgi:hypothetical protein